MKKQADRKDDKTARVCRYTNRELSWLQFNERVLEESEDHRVPRYERLKFIAIFQSNLDEFFMVRVGSLFDQAIADKKAVDARTGMTAQQQLRAIYQEVRNLLPRKDTGYHKLMGKLSKEGVQQLTMSSLDPEEYQYLQLYFEREIMPLISPQIIDKRQPFPFLKNKEIYVGVNLASKSGDVRLGIISSSGLFNRLIILPSAENGVKFVLAEDLICFFAEKVFNKHQVLEKTIFRITRNADINVEDSDELEIDFRTAMEELLKKRRRLAPVRLELNSPVSDNLRDYFCQQLTLQPEQVFVDTSPLDLSFAYAMEDMVAKQHPQLFFKPQEPQLSNQVSEQEPMMAQIERKDLLFYYPYHSMDPFLRLLKEAAKDPDVISIKITLYRVAKHSKIVNALIQAAENGKEVGVMVELRARFDEENNIDWSKRLEEAGCNVIYGLPGYKVHSKLCLITRKVGNKIKYTTQVGTGNYNEKTSRIYTDLSFMTSRPDIAADASVVFNSLFTGTVVESVENLLVAPLCCKSRIVTMIDEEIAFAKRGEPAKIRLKMNSITDKDLIDKLYEAAAAGVPVEMVVRGICCMKPIYPNITIISIVGRYLEHARIYSFGVGERKKLYIASADFMTRNTEHRVEVGAPIADPALKQQLEEILDIMFRDNQKARIQQPDGSYVYRIQEGEPPLDSQQYFWEQAYEQAQQAKQFQPVAFPPAPEKKEGFFARLFGRKKDR